MMENEWQEKETNTHQDHVIAHVVGATVLGYFTANEAAHLLLDIGFVWIVYLDGEMGLVPQKMAISEIELDEATKMQLRSDAQVLENPGADDVKLERFTEASGGCLITDVRFQERENERRLQIVGEDASLAIEMSLTTAEICVKPV